MDMVSFINDSAQVYLKDYQGPLHGECTAVQFERDGDMLVCDTNFHYCVARGHVRYRLNGELRSTLRWTFLLSADLKRQQRANSLPASKEIAFFKVMVPQFLQLTRTSMRRMFPESYVSRLGSTEASEKLVTIFDCPPGSMLSEGELLDFTLLRLMARKIGQFHAYSLKARSVDPDFGRRSNFVRQTYAASDDVVDKLRRCLARMPRNPLPALPVAFRCSVNNIQAMLNEFPARLRAAFDRDEAGGGWVLCHQNYGQASALFRSRESELSVRIFNWHSAGFASLGVDLVIMLLVEAAPEVRSRAKFTQLVGVYREALAGMFPDIQVPTVDEILAQVRLCIPVALHVLANRVLDSEAAQDEDEVPEEQVWTDQLILRVYEYLIAAAFI